MNSKKLLLLFINLYRKNASPLVRESRVRLPLETNGVLVKPSLPVLRDAQHPEVRFSLPIHIIAYTLFEVTYPKSLQRVAVNKKGPFPNAVDCSKGSRSQVGWLCPGDKTRGLFMSIRGREIRLWIPTLLNLLTLGIKPYITQRHPAWANSAGFLGEEGCYVRVRLHCRRRWTVKSLWRKSKDCPSEMTALAIIISVIGAVLVVASALLPIWRVLATIQAANPIFQPTTTTFQNPMYGVQT